MNYFDTVLTLFSTVPISLCTYGVQVKCNALILERKLSIISLTNDGSLSECSIFGMPLYPKRVHSTSTNFSDVFPFQGIEKDIFVGFL